MGDGEKEVDPNQAFYDSGSGGAAKKAKKAVTAVELAEHNKKDDCWVALLGKVYDVTSFLEDHPGGAKAIMMYAGKEATEPFLMLHKEDVLDKYVADLEVGEFQEAAKL